MSASSVLDIKCCQLLFNANTSDFNVIGKCSSSPSNRLDRLRVEGHGCCVLPASSSFFKLDPKIEECGLVPSLLEFTDLTLGKLSRDLLHFPHSPFLVSCNRGRSMVKILLPC